MIEVTESEFQKNFDDYIERIEQGESFMIRRPDGRAVVAVPAADLAEATESVGISDDESWYNTYSNHDDGC